MVGRPNAQREEELVLRLVGHALAIGDATFMPEEDGVLQAKAFARRIWVSM